MEKLAGWPEAYNRLIELRDLEDNRDGEGSCGIYQTIWDAAGDMLLNIMSYGFGGVLTAPFICPIPGGTLQFEWTIGKRHVEIEFIDKGNVLVLRHDMLTDKMETEEISIANKNFRAIMKHMNWLRSVA